jgi:hypothetical protein
LRPDRQMIMFRRLGPRGLGVFARTVQQAVYW